MSDENLATDVNQPVEGVIAPNAIAAQQEKMVPQSEVDKIVGARLARERERMMSEQQPMQMGGMPQQASQGEGFDFDSAFNQRIQAYEQQRMAEIEREQQKAQAEEIARKYIESQERGKTLFDDYDTITQDVTPAAYPQVTIMASQYDNMPEILYELGGNPRKLVDLHVMAITNPNQAKREMAKLAQSIRNNEQALAQNQKSPQPLTRLKSSAVAGQDTGKRTISDLRKDPRFRG